MTNSRITHWAGRRVALAITLLGLMANQAGAGCKIGILTPLTGPSAAIGEAVRNAAQMAAAESGCEVVLEDNELNAAKSASAATKLVSIDKVGALISSSSGPGNAVAPIAAKAGIPHIATATDTAITRQKGSILLYTSAAALSQGLVTELKARHVQSVAVIGLKNQGVDQLRSELRPRLKGAGIALLLDETYQSGDKDFRVMLTKLSSKKPALTILLGFSPEADIVLRQARELGGLPPFTSMGFFDYIKERSLTEGLWMATTATGAPAWRAAYRKKFGKEPTGYAPFIYDAVLLLAGIQKEGKGREAFLATTSYKGVAGTYNQPHAGMLDVAAEIVVMQNGQPQPAQKGMSGKKAPRR